MIAAENPLKIAVLHIVRTATASISEYELIGLLKKETSRLPSLCDSQQLALFQIHFLVMNALYQLQAELREEGLYLAISPLAIVLHPAADKDAKSLVGDDGEQKLREYYLDLRHLHDTGEEDVLKLLGSFWQRYNALDQAGDAYRCLDATPADSWTLIQKNYRRLAAKHHPDRGGDVKKFLAVREAYEILSNISQRHRT